MLQGHNLILAAECVLWARSLAACRYLSDR